jgi:hypothetical protein
MATPNLKLSIVTLTIAASAYAVVRWFFLGLTASKWIGLPQYAAMMQSVQNQSRNWGIAALMLEAIAISFSALLLGKPVKPIPSSSVTGPAQSTDHWLARAGLCVLGTVAMILVLFLIIFVAGYLRIS